VVEGESLLLNFLVWKAFVTVSAKLYWKKRADLFRLPP